jgi:hypothetical protein
MLIRDWDKLIEEFKTSGKSQAQWCREKNLKIKAFSYQYRKRRRITQNKPCDEQINWMPVKLEQLTSTKLSVRVGKAIIEIENGYNERLLQSVVKSLEAIC